MNKPWAPALTFFLGVFLTVGVYEGLRLVQNARNALNVASNQMQGSDASPPETRALARPADRTRTVQRDAIPRQAARPPEGFEPGAARAKATRSLSERRQILKDKLAEMTPEEREELAAKRAARKDRQRQRLLQLKALRDRELAGRPGEGAPLDAPDAPAEPVDTAEPAAQTAAN